MKRYSPLSALLCVLLLSCSSSPVAETGEPVSCSVLSFSISCDDTPALGDDITYTVTDNGIYGAYSYMTDETALAACIPRVRTDAGSYSFSSDRSNGDGTYDMRGSCTLTLTDGSFSREYTVRTERICYDIPSVSIYIDGGAEVENREDSLMGKLSMSGGGYEDISDAEITIGGRGHSTWQWDKKPYKIKFTEKTSVFGLTARRDWVLLSNYADKSLIRNTLAMELAASLDGLRYTPHQYPVDLFVNGTYRGVYTMGEKIETGNGRIDIEVDYDDPDTGYLMEVGGTDDGIDVKGKDYFHTETVRFIRIKSPDTDIMSESHFNFIRDFVTAADEAIRSGGDYEKYIDTESFIDWFILQELSYNLDSCFRRSCYITKEAGGLLYMSPVWDFDLAFGNFSQDNSEYDDLASCGGDDDDDYIKTTWYDYLLKDEKFLSLLKERWSSVGEELLGNAKKVIAQYSSDVSDSAVYNFEVWDIMDIRAGYQPAFMTEMKTYKQHTDYLMNFVIQRYEYLKDYVNS